MDRTKILASSALFLCLLISVSLFVLDQTSVKNQEQKYNTSIQVVDAENKKNMSFGINADRNLRFGRIITGTNATKFLNMSSGKKSLLTVNTEGNISEFMVYEEKMYFQGDKQIPLEVRGREPGNYTGTVNLEFQIPENEVGRKWLDLKYRVHELR